MGSRRCCRGSGLRQRPGPAIGRVIRWRQIEEVRFAADSPVEGADLHEDARFARDSLLEGDGFEPSVPRQKDNAFRDSSFPTCARYAAFENARRPVQQLLLPVVDPVRMNAELTRQLGDRPVLPTAGTTTPSL